MAIHVILCKVLEGKVFSLIEPDSFELYFVRGQRVPPPFLSNNFFALR
ncbi:hypothetical protein KN1_11170 [Stygiolobus caldivivus]|uniref:Uncharacterized protein n=1 Tax=Stygiolobus caldivivus TaxID=2824673 RepID=A0A8D5U5D0_9CREN|nr:hypothetical protein KN1_11170 [Stygiolobus caldivivus]